MHANVHCQLITVSPQDYDLHTKSYINVVYANVNKLFILAIAVRKNEVCILLLDFVEDLAA